MFVLTENQLKRNEMWFVVDNHNYMCHIMCERFFGFELQAVIDKIWIFTKLPQIGTTHKKLLFSNYNLKGIDQLLLPHKLYDRVMQRIYFFCHLCQLLALNIFLSQVMKHEGVIIFTSLHFFQGKILHVSGGRSALLILIFKKSISENKNSNNKSTLNLQNDEYLIQLERELEWFPLSSAIGNKGATIFFGIGGS